MTQQDINENEWASTNNWRYLIFYYSKKDSRVWVPKKQKWRGWTLNLAKRQGVLWMFCLLILPVCIAVFTLVKY
ncbi:MAG: hypothetical protein HOB14_21075 [Gammaproteobacteria bacterium]|jgi:uncharacterized membrane protein|nr:hypothetical protein [Gammaproteobacteria bacterium]MBT6704150.1 hypothetical protein [Gammaproteobacteria bacterium]MBT7047184.1 hypothetical protein [Gammaproteobacteria bacterium]